MPPARRARSQFHRHATSAASCCPHRTIGVCTVGPSPEWVWAGWWLGEPTALSGEALLAQGRAIADADQPIDRAGVRYGPKSCGDTIGRMEAAGHYLIDSMIFDKLADDEATLAAATRLVKSRRIALLSTHVQRDELSRIPDGERRQRL